jgi:hypothetical protein
MGMVNRSSTKVASKRVFEKYRLIPPTPLERGVRVKVPRLVPFHDRGTRPERHPLFKGDLGGLTAYDCHK